MLFENYRRLSQRDRALVDGRLITYHFYVGGLTLLVLGFAGLGQGEGFAWAVVVFGFAGLAAGAAMHLLHRHLVHSFNRDAYLAILSAVLGHYRYPLLPAIFTVFVAFSLLATLIYLLTH
jgi:hypothetical protein